MHNTVSGKLVSVAVLATANKQACHVIKYNLTQNNQNLKISWLSQLSGDYWQLVLNTEAL